MKSILSITQTIQWKMGLNLIHDTVNKYIKIDLSMSQSNSHPIPLCYLCQKRPASPRKSHFTPASATENIFGERNKEEVYAISANEVEIESYFGRQNSKNTDTTIKKDLNTEPYVFCKECEENLGNIEQKVTPLLNAATEQLSRDKIKIKRTGRFQKYFELPIHPNLLSTYLYSIVWRQAFRQIYDGNDKIFSDQFYDNLRTAVAELIEMEEAVTIELTRFASLPNIACFTTIHKEILTDTVNPNSKKSNPELFFMGAFDCLIFTDSLEYSGFRKATGLKLEIMDKDLYINQSKKSRILVIPPSHWEEKSRKHKDHQVDVIWTSAILPLASKKGIPPSHAKNLLHNLASQIEKETKQGYAISFSQAFKALMEQ